MFNPCHSEYQTQGFTHAQEVLYHLRHIPSPSSIISGIPAFQVSLKVGQTVPDSQEGVGSNSLSSDLS